MSYYFVVRKALEVEWYDEMLDASESRTRLALDLVRGHTPKFFDKWEAEQFAIRHSEHMRMQRQTVVIGWIE